MAATAGPSTATEAARALLDAYDIHDVDTMVDLCAEDAQIRYVPMGEQGQGAVDHVGRGLWSGLIESFPDLHVAIDSVMGDDRHAAVEAVLGGTQERDYLGIESRGAHYELPHAFLVEADSTGRITEITAYWDNASFYEQLGKTELG